MSLVLAFYKGRRAENHRAQLFDRLVCWWPRSRGPFSHVELVTDLGCGSGWCWSASSRAGCVRQEWINLASGSWVLVDLQAHDGEAAAAWMAARAGVRYDWPGIFGFVLPSIKQKRQWLYCSEACAEAVRAGAQISDPALPLEWPTSTISPSALYAWAFAQLGARAIDPKQ